MVGREGEGGKGNGGGGKKRMGVGHVGEKMTREEEQRRIGWNKRRRVEGQWTGKDILQILSPHTKAILWHQEVHRKFAGL